MVFFLHRLNVQVANCELALCWGINFMLHTGFNSLVFMYEQPYIRTKFLCQRDWIRASFLAFLEWLV